MLLLNCVTCGNTKSKFIIEQIVNGLLNSLEIRTCLNKVPFLALFCFRYIK